MNHNGTILIVDDDIEMHETLRLILHRGNYNLEYAQDGFEALRKAEQLGVNLDLVLLDIVMPGMNGLEVCRQLRNHDVLGQVPIIIVTNLDDQDSWTRAMDAGADAYIIKPFDMIEIRTRVRNVIHLNRFRRLTIERTKFDWVVKQLGEGIVVLDEQQRITYANKQARLFLGLPPGEAALTPSSFLSLIDKHYTAEPQEAWHNWPAETPAGVTRYLQRPESNTAGTFRLHVDNLRLPSTGKDSHLVRLRQVTAPMDC
jgi:two-component system, cell cycle response regulator